MATLTSFARHDGLATPLCSGLPEAKLKEVAKEFETMFLTHVLESVFSNIPDSSHESAMFKSFWAEAVAKSASQKSFGITDMVFKCLVKQQSNGQLELAQMKRSYSIQSPGGYYA
ncbi:MAG: hypothetical protein HYS39_00210, partial [Proteobacteria bacterium]|nr:hypothetical protein [Pseudomonadota bacterium]